MEKYKKKVSIDGAEFTVARINETNYANIYGVKDSAGRIVGTVEERLAGAGCWYIFHRMGRRIWKAGYTQGVHRI